MKANTIVSIVPIYSANTGALMYYKAVATTGNLYTALGISFDNRHEALSRSLHSVGKLIERTEGTNQMLKYQNNLNLI